MRLGKGENERMGDGIRPYMSRFANNALLGGGITCRVRVWTREFAKKDQKKIKGTAKPLLAILDISRSGN